MQAYRLARYLLLLMLLSLVAIPGCGGCDSSTPEETAEEEKELENKKKEKPPFEKPRLYVLPNQALPEAPADDEQAAAETIAYRAVKAGHWTTASQEMKANNEDFVGGRLNAAVTDSKGQPLELDRLPYRLSISRPATLPKGQTRHLELTFFTPVVDRRPLIETRLTRSGSEAMPPTTEVLDPMPAHQYYFVVLASTADRYRFVERLQTVRAPDPQAPYYRVVLPIVTTRVPLSSHSLTWTNTACVLWDGINPDILTPEQQTALVDWLHWGGQLIISGPGSMELLRGSFLKDYLPASSSDARDISASDLKPLSDYWSITESHGRDSFSVVRPWSGIVLTPKGTGRPLAGTSDLVVEGSVGHGRIVITSFSLSQRELISWPSFDSFFNNAVLRRPRRAFERNTGDFGEIRSRWADYPGRQLDPSLVTRLNYFSRDLLRSSRDSARPLQIDTANLSADSTQLQTQYEIANNLLQPAAFKEFDRGPGVAGWSDFGPVAASARDSLRDAAGIEVPKTSFVLAVLLTYLVVLVPLNWTIFKVVERVEWAWIAAPVISIACALSVIKLAQLDIGFARSRREIAVVEMQSGYPRAHITRFMALYTSLSTGYSVEFEDPSAVALPFPVDSDPEHLRNRSRSTVTFRRDQNVALTDFSVLSNSTSMIHSEEMGDMAGSVQLIGSAVSSGLPSVVTDAAAFRAANDGSLEVAWLGTLKPGESKSLHFMSLDKHEDLLSSWTAPPESDSAEDIDRHTLSRMLLLNLEKTGYTRGQIRLVGLLEQPPPGVVVEPEASQVRHATMLIVNLAGPTEADPQPDANLPPADLANSAEAE